MQVARFQLAPVWASFYWSIVALNILQLIWRTWELWSADWSASRTASRMVFKALGLIPLWLLIQAPGHVLFSLTDPAVDPSHLGPTINLVNRSVHQALELVAVIIVLQLAWEIGRAGFERYRQRQTVR